jgi:hypothetical protein
MPKVKLHWQIAIALVLAVIVGRVTGTDTVLFGINVYSVYDFFGTLFLNALKMLIVPLVVSSIITGMAGASQSEGFGRLGVKTILYYLTTSLLAILVGLALVNLFQPGIVDGQPAKSIIGLSADTSGVLTRTEGRGASDVIEVFLRMVPTNIVAAAAKGQLLGLIFFSLLFGFFMTRINEVRAGRCICAGGQGCCQYRIRGVPAVGGFHGHRAGGAGGTQLHHHAAAVALCRAGQSGAPLSRHGAGHVDRVFHRVVFGYPAINHGLCGEECRCLQPHFQFRVAARRHGKHGWHRAV